MIWNVLRGGVRTGAYLILPFHRRLSFLDYYLRAARELKGCKHDVYHAHDLNTLLIAWWHARRNRARLVYDSHELYLHRNMAKPYSKFGRFMIGLLEGYLVRSADLNITVNETIAHALSKQYGVEPFKVVMNTPSYVREATESSESDLRSALKLAPNCKLLLYAGAIMSNRGLENVIEGLQYVGGCEFVMMGMGDPVYKQKLIKCAESAGVADRVHYFGPVPSNRVTSFASTADLGIAPIMNVCLSYYYCSPNKLFEYVMAGLPVLASDFPELRKVVLDYRIGLTFDPEDSRDIARQIRYMLDRPEFLQEAKRNLATAAAAFNWENESQKLLACYEKLAPIR